MKNNSFARAVFIFDISQTFSEAFYVAKRPVLQLCGRRNHIMTNVQFCLISEALVAI